MNFTCETKRLILRILHPTQESAAQVLAFHNKNRAAFERYEAARTEDFYTEACQKSLLSLEYDLALRQEGIRYYVYEKDNPSQIIGTICFYHIMYSIYNRCEAGYKFDSHYWHRGYATESLLFGIRLMTEELGLHRIEAYVMEENAASIRLLSALGFQYEGVCRQFIRIRDKWEDHMRFALIRSYDTNSQNCPSCNPSSSPCKIPENQTLQP